MSNTSFDNKPVEDIYYFVTQLAKARSIAAAANAAYAKKKKALQKEMDAALESLKIEAAEAEQVTLAARALVDQAALSRYDGVNKQVHPAVKIREYKVLDYDPADALEHCRQHLPEALKLDKRQFEKTAKTRDLEFVSISTDPRPTVSTNLSDYE